MVKLADFGTARKARRELAKTKKAGSPLYMAPECFTSSDIPPDQASDIWSLGVIFYYMICKLLPF